MWVSTESTLVDENEARTTSEKWKFLWMPSVFESWLQSCCNALRLTAIKSQANMSISSLRLERTSGQLSSLRLLNDLLNMLHRIWKNRVKESSIKCRESGILPSVRVQNPVTYIGTFFFHVRTVVRVKMPFVRMLHRYTSTAIINNIKQSWRANSMQHQLLPQGVYSLINLRQRS